MYKNIKTRLVVGKAATRKIAALLGARTGKKHENTSRGNSRRQLTQKLEMNKVRIGMERLGYTKTSFESECTERPSLSTRARRRQQSTAQRREPWARRDTWAPHHDGAAADQVVEAQDMAADIPRPRRS